MGFTDLVSDAGLAVLNNFLVTRSYITGYVFFFFCFFCVRFCDPS